MGGFGEGFGRKSEAEPAEPAAYRCTAPEQWRGDAVGRRTDVYAMGCVFYEALAGKPPFRPDSINGLRATHLASDFVPLTKEAPQVKPWISAWVVKLLDPDMETRPKDAAAALNLFSLRDQLLPPAQGPSPALPPGYASQTAPHPYPSPAPITSGKTGMVRLTRAVAPVTGSSTSAFQPVSLAHKTSAVNLRSPQRAVPHVSHVSLTPAPRVTWRTKSVLIGGGAAALVIAIVVLMLMPSKPLMAPVAERLAMRLPVTNGLLLHLDAGRHDTIDSSITNRVRRWSDAEDKTRYAAPPAPEAGPELHAAALHDLPVLDFGPLRSEHWMEFKSAKGETRHLTNIRTVFWMMRGAGFLLSDDQTTDFHRGGDEGAPDARIIGGNPSDGVKRGTLRLNGIVVKTLETALPKDFSLISLTTATPATASRLCKDRTGGDRVGGQEIAELAVFDRALSDVEIKQVETYLRTKWLAP